MVVRILAVGLALVALAVPSVATETVVDLSGLVTVSGRAAANAVVWLDAGAAAAGRSANAHVRQGLAGPAVLRQRSLKFAPQVLAVQAGTVVDFPNDDRVFHNVFSFRDGKKFDLGVYPVGSTRQVTFTQAGVSRLFCNIHPNMAGYVVVVDTRWFGSSDAEGRFHIADVEPGTYTWHAWRAAGPVVSGSVAVRAGAVLEVAWP
jgi:plastocyanin